MKKVGIIALVVLLIVGAGAGGYLVYKFYKASNDPLIKIIKNIDDLKVSESVAFTKTEYSKEFFDKAIKGLPSEGIPNDILTGVISKMFKNLTVKSEQKLVLDPSREDFGIKLDTDYLYSNNELISLDVATDFDIFTLGIPQLLNKTVKIPFKDLIGSSNDKPVDFKAYLDILKVSDFPSDRKKIYFKAIREFLNEERFKKIDPMEVYEPKHDFYDRYELSLTYTEQLELVQILLDVLKDDEITQTYIVGKMDAVFEQYIDSGDYKFTNMSKEDLEESYAKDKAEFLSKLKNGNIDVLKLAEENITDFAYMKDYKFKYTFALNDEDQIRHFRYNRDGIYDKTDMELVFNAIGDEVAVEPILDLSNTYDEELDLDAPAVSLMKVFGKEALDNLTKKILGSPAVESIIGDAVKELKSSPDFEGKNDTIEKVKNIKETIEQMIMLYQMFGQ